MATDGTPMSFDPPRRDRLRSAYNKARLDGKEAFQFEGADLLTDYAKYLLEYLDNKFGR